MALCPDWVSSRTFGLLWARQFCSGSLWAQSIWRQTGRLIVYGLGIGLFFVFSAWVLFSRRGSKYHPPFEEMLTEQGMDWLQAAAFGRCLLGGIHYMNALYQNQQNLAYREVLSWAAFLILTMVSPAVLFSKKGGRRALIGLIAGGIWYVVQSLTQKEALQTNELLGKQIFWS